MVNRFSEIYRNNSHTEATIHLSIGIASLSSSHSWKRNLLIDQLIIDRQSIKY